MSFSIIFQGFAGNIHALRETFEQVFGQTGCYASLAWDKERKHTPCELAANLSEADAQAKIALLTQAGVRVTLLPTAEVTDAAHRAAECWPTHVSSNGETFTLLENLVLSGCSLNTRESLRESRQEPDFTPWGFELGYNHEHPSHTLDRAGLRAAREHGAELAAALKECFPNSAFLISYRDVQVSFCQFTPELPTGITPVERRVDDLRVPSHLSGQCFCERCKSIVSYAPRPTPDPEFPHAQFADCNECGSEVILWVDDEAVAL